MAEATVSLLAITPDSEKLIESAGRTCYMSFNRADDQSAAKFIRMLIRNGHLSVLEHAYATFRIQGGSRSFTHQIVRHRLCSFSQQSQRYVSEQGFDYVTPPSISENPEALDVYNEFMAKAQECYERLHKLGITNQDARFILPNATCSEIVISANFRELRHVISERCQLAAQWEIRRIVCQMLEILQCESPAVFGDFEINRDNWTAISGL